jgi:hypothetical protein
MIIVFRYIASLHLSSTKTMIHLIILFSHFFPSILMITGQSKTSPDRTYLAPVYILLFSPPNEI